MQHPHRPNKLALGILLVASYIIMQPSLAQNDFDSADTDIEELVIWGRSLLLLGTANSASQGVVGYDDFSTRPLARVAELVEVIPGMIAAVLGKAKVAAVGFDHEPEISILTRSIGAPTPMPRAIWIRTSRFSETAHDSGDFSRGLKLNENL